MRNKKFLNYLLLYLTLARLLYHLILLSLRMRKISCWIWTRIHLKTPSIIVLRYCNQNMIKKNLDLLVWFNYECGRISNIIITVIILMKEHFDFIRNLLKNHIHYIFVDIKSRIRLPTDVKIISYMFQDVLENIFVIQDTYGSWMNHII